MLTMVFPTSAAILTTLRSYSSGIFKVLDPEIRLTQGAMALVPLERIPVNRPTSSAPPREFRYTPCALNTTKADMTNANIS